MRFSLVSLQSGLHVQSRPRLRDSPEKYQQQSSRRIALRGFRDAYVLGCRMRPEVKLKIATRKIRVDRNSLGVCERCSPAKLQIMRTHRLERDRSEPKIAAACSNLGRSSQKVPALRIRRQIQVGGRGGAADWRIGGTPIAVAQNLASGGDLYLRGQPV